MAAFYWVVQLATAPDPDAAQIKAGLDGNDASLPATQKGSVADIGQTFLVDADYDSIGLATLTTYKVAWVWNEGGVDSNVVVGSFNTAGASVVGGLAANEFLDQAAFSGARTYFGLLAVTEASDVAAFAGTMIPKFATGAFAVTEAIDTFAASGAVGPPTGRFGDLAAVETRDVAAFSGARTYFGALDATEARDSAAFAGTQIPSFSSGDFAAEESRDLAAVTGTATTGVPVSGGLAVTEVRDVAAFSGARTYFGAMAAAEARDNAAFSGFITKFITGTMAAIESRDTALFAANPIVGSNFIILRDANMGLNVSPQQEWRDGAPRNPDGRLLPSKIGSVEVPNNLTNRRDITRREVRLVQAPQDTQAQVDVIPGYYSFIAVKAGEWVWCLSRDNAVDDADNPIGQDDVVV